MRKWMRERIQRRKKATPKDSGQPAPPPLQPAYFDADQLPPESHLEPVEAAEIHEPEPESQPVQEEPAATASPDPRLPAQAGGDSQRGRGRRRRGGRGRGGRGREQAVAQAFTPAAVKGIIPDVNADAGEDAAPESGELQSADLHSLEAPAEPQAEAEVPAPHAPRIPATIPAAPPRPPKGIVVLAIGLPGSGKSSWFKRHNLAPLSSDMMRALLFDDLREQRFQDLVFSNLRSMLKARLIAKRPMNYVDATNLTPQERQHWIKLAKDYNYEVHAVFFDVPLEVCLERHQRRDRVVPEDIMRRMAAKLKPPAFDEGFAKITVVRVKKKE
jgi:predicted kinase